MSSNPPKRIAVIGAGLSGVVAAAHLKKEGLDVTVFERNSDSGGLWIYDERKPLDPSFPSIQPSKAEIPYEGSTLQNGDPDDIEYVRLRHAPPGPCYSGLRNNIGTRLLQLTLNPFAEGTPDFVSHDVLKDYIQETAFKTGVHDITKYNTEVKNLVKEGEKWRLDAVTLKSGDGGKAVLEGISEEFDSIVVASGHYHAPHIPDIPGLSAWKRMYPDRISHCKSYRRPEDFKGKNFLLIGAGVSSTDISRELGPHARKIYQSQRGGQYDPPAFLLPENCERIDEIASFSVPSTHTQTESLDETSPIPLTLTTKSGKVIKDIDHIILCTGYLFTTPFLSYLHCDSDTTTPTSPSPSPATLITTGFQMHNLHKDIFYIPDPSLAFVGVPYYNATFTLFEFQAMVVAKVFSGLVKLPGEEAMRQEYRKRVGEKGYGKPFHSLQFTEVEYVEELVEWVNGDLRRGGRELMRGHTKEWREAKREQVEKVRALLAGEKMEQEFFK